MKLTKFSFQNEPIWILIFSLAPFVIGLLILLIASILR